MSAVVLDASVTMVWCFPDEANDYADQVWLGLKGRTVQVPAIWAPEVANAVLSGEKRKRLKDGDVQEFLAVLGGLTITQDMQGISSLIENVLPLARKHRLSTYDATYLELALRLDLPIATLDGPLRRAAEFENVPIFAQ